MNNYSVNINDLNCFEDIIKQIDLYGVGFIAVVDNDNKLIGIVTDGDVRRAILKKKKDVMEVINKTPLTLPYLSPENRIIRFLRHHRRLHLPLVDTNNVLKEVFLLNSFDKVKLPNNVVIMVGGLGSRLGELTKNTPKPMLLIKGKPILEYIIESFKNQGFNKFILCVNYKKEIIQNYFKKGENLGVTITYIVEEKRLGTAGALSLINKEEFKEPFFVVNGDVLTTIDYTAMLNYFNTNNADAVMSVKNMDYINPYAAVDFDQEKNLIGLKEKPTFSFVINTGVYLLKHSVLELLPYNDFFDMPDLFLTAKEKNFSVKVFSFDDDWVDIGKPLDYLSIRND